MYTHSVSGTVGSPRNYGAVPERAFDDAELGYNPLRVLGRICCHGDKFGRAWPSQDTIAKKLDLSRETVNRAIKRLVKRGYLTKARRAGGRSLMYVVQYEDSGKKAGVGKPCDVTPNVTLGDVSTGVTSNVSTGVTSDVSARVTQNITPTPSPPCRDGDGVGVPDHEIRTTEGHGDVRAPSGNGAANADAVAPLGNGSGPWPQRLRWYRESGVWREPMWGTAPGEPGCRAPQDLLAEYGLLSTDEDPTSAPQDHG